jgi:hypothetical protein
MDEFNDILPGLVGVLQSRRIEAGLKRTEQFVICIDHASEHAEAQQCLPPGWQLLPHPAHSPDCNKPIEHVHGQLDDLMHHWLVEWRRLHPAGNPTPDECKAQCLAFFNAISTASLEADIASLPSTWQEIIRVGGEYTAPRFA